MDHQKFLVYGVGMFSGIITALFPLSVIKIRQMSSTDCSPGLAGARDTGRQILRQEGIRGLYRGYGTVLAGAIPARMLYLPTYEYVRAEVRKTLEASGPANLSETAISSAASLVGGATASLASSAVVVPVDVISSRLMVERTGGAAASAATAPAGAAAVASTSLRSSTAAAASAAAAPGAHTPMLANSGGGSAAAAAPGQAAHAVPRRSMASTASSSAARMNGLRMAQQIVRTEGALGLYRGFGMSIMTYTPSSAVWWSSYAVYQDLIWGGLYAAEFDVSSSNTWAITGVQALAGTMSGTTAAILTTPLDIVKTQLQVAKSILAREGLAGFWRGAVPRVMNVALWGTCMVTTYEILKRLCLIDEEKEA